MGIDASIAGSYKPLQLENPLNAMLQVGQFQNMQQSNQLNALKMADAQRAQAATNALNAAYSSAYDPATGKLDYTRLRTSLAAGGQGGQLPVIDKAQQEFAMGEAELASKRDTARDAFQKHMQTAFRDISGNPSDAQITAHLEDVLANPNYAPEQKTQVKRQAQMLLSMPYDQRIAHMASQGATAGDLKPTYRTQDLGNVSRVTQSPAFGGTPQVVSESPMGVSPNTRAQIDAQAAQGRLNRSNSSANAATTRPAQPPVQAVDPATGQVVFVSRDEAIGKRLTPAAAIEGLTPKARQAREAAYPKATAALNGFASNATRLEKDLRTLAAHPGLNGITGLVGGRTPGILPDARAAEALYNSIVARGGFQELAAMRDSSLNGSALGSVTDVEGRYLRDAFAPLKLTQSKDSLAKALLDAASQVRSSQANIRGAYDMTYEYRTQGPRAPAQPPAPSGVVDFGSLR